LEWLNTDTKVPLPADLTVLLNVAWLHATTAISRFTA